MKRSLLVPLFLLLSFATAALALEVGDAAPAFEGQLDTGETWKSSDAGDKTVIVYFYPAAMTGGCTKQASKNTTPSSSASAATSRPAWPCSNRTPNSTSR